MNKPVSSEKQLNILSRGVDSIYSIEDLKNKIADSLKENKPLRVKLGLDPTAPDIHLGHTVVLRKMRQFQDLGHQAVLIIGDATAKIGDPTGKSTTRPVLTDEEIKKNLDTYLDQVKEILDLEKVEVVFNSKFFSDMMFNDLMQLAGKITVARLLERDDFQKRYKSGTPISLHEFFYPLMQGWDSVMVKSDIELGGTDQTFNNLVGRDLQRGEGQKAQVVIVMPILPGLDGVQKMSKSLGNYIGVKDTPKDMFGKVMSIPDSLMKDYFILLTNIPDNEIAEILSGNPREAKGRLGREIVTLYYSAEKAVKADEEFKRIFAEKKLPNDIPEVKIDASDLADNSIWICKLMVICKHANSTSEARRLVQGGAVSIDNEKISDPKAQVKPESGQVLKSGKRRFALLKI